MTRPRLGLGFVLLVAALAGPAAAAGIAGIELTPEGGPGDTGPGLPTAFHVRVPMGGATRAAFLLRNTTAEPRSCRLYGAGVTGIPPDITVGDAGGASWVRLPSQEVTLQPGETRRFEVAIADPGLRAGARAYAAIVIEVQENPSLIARAATVVYAEISAREPGVRRSLSALTAVAVCILALTIGLHLSRRRARVLT